MNYSLFKVLNSYKCQSLHHQRNNHSHIVRNFLWRWVKHQVSKQSQMDAILQEVQMDRILKRAWIRFKNLRDQKLGILLLHIQYRWNNQALVRKDPMKRVKDSWLLIVQVLQMTIPRRLNWQSLKNN